MRKKKLPRNKPLQISLVKTRKGYSVHSQSLAGILKNEEGLTLEELFKFIVTTKLHPVDRPE